MKSHRPLNMPGLRAPLNRHLLACGLVSGLGLGLATAGPGARAQGAVGGASLGLEQALQADRKTVPYAQAVAALAKDAPTQALYRRTDGVALSSANSGLPPAADEGLWRRAAALPEGSRIEMRLSAASAPADGQSPLWLTLRVSDAQGRTLTQVGGAPLKLLLETTQGRFQVPGVPQYQRATAPAGQTHSELATVEVLLRDGELRLPLLAPTLPGEALLRASSGPIGVQGAVRFLPDLRPLLVVGVVEGALQSAGAGRSNRSAPAIVNGGFEDPLQQWSRSSLAGERRLSGRAALYAVGTVFDQYLLTVAADSDKVVSQRLFRDVDPNAFYPIYGDASLKQFDAQGKGRVFARIDRDRSFLLYGDYTTDSGPLGPHLGSYQRSLTGAKGRYEADGLAVNGWAARDTLRSYTDEQPGRGISGPYAVGQANAITNSEQIELLVRDRRAPALVLKRQRLTRYVDYDFEPFSGRVLFRQPVPSVDENDNPVSIRMVYEVDEGGAKFWVSGVDARLQLSEPLSVGASHAHDANPLAPYQVSGLQAQARLGEHTHLRAEWAQSRGTEYFNASLAAGLGLNPLPGTATTGQAARLELRHSGPQLQGRVVAARSGAAFQNASAGLAPGRDEASVEGSVDLTDSLRLTGQFSHTGDHSGLASHGARRNALALGLRAVLGESVTLELGLHQVADRQVAGSAGVLSPVDAQATSLPGLGWGSNTSFGFNGMGGLASPSTLVGLSPTPGVSTLVDQRYTSLRARLTGKLGERTAVFGELEHAVDGSDRQRAAVGAEYRINDKSRLYARHSMADSLLGDSRLGGDGSSVRRTVLGVDSAYMQGGQIYSEYRLAGAHSGQDAAAALGVRNLWRLREGFNLTTALELQTVRSSGQAGLGQGAQQAQAVSLGADYLIDALSKTGGKLEYRTSTAQDSWLSTWAYDRKLSDDWAALVRNLYLHQRAQGSSQDNGAQTQDRFQLGLAYRDTLENQWHALGRVERRIQRSSALAAPADSGSWIASLHANHHPNRAWTFSGETAFKAVNERLPAPTAATTAAGLAVASLGPAQSWRAGLISGRAVWDFAERFDASVYASLQRGGGSRLHGLGAELGYRVMDNLWLSAGHTAGRFSDVEAFAGNAHWSGWHLRLRFKFDEALFASGQAAINRSLPEAGATPRRSANDR